MATTRVSDWGPDTRKVRSNIPTVRTSTRIEAARTPGTNSGKRIFVRTFRMLAPDIRAAFSIAGSICSMNGVMVMMTKGTEGTRLIRITAHDGQHSTDRRQGGQTVLDKCGTSVTTCARSDVRRMVTQFGSERRS